MRQTRPRCTGLLCVLGILAICLSFSLGGTSAVRAAGTFTDRQGRFSFAIPDGLTSNDSYVGQRIAGSEVAAFLSADVSATSPTFHNNVNVTITNTASNTMNLDDLALTSVRQLSNDLHATPDGTGIQSVTLGGLPARQYGYLSVFGGITFHVLQAFVLKGDNAYVITIRASEDSYADFVAQTHDILTSFTFDPAM